MAELTPRGRRCFYSPMLEPVLLLLNVVAAANGVCLAIIMVFQERFGRTQIRLSFAGFIFLMSILLGAFVAMDSGAIVFTDQLGVALDLMALTASAAFLHYISAACAKPVHPAIYAPAGIYLLSVLWAGGRYLAPTDIGPIIVAQIAYSLVALYLYFSSRSNLPSAVAARRENRLLPALFTGVGLLHLAQVLRLLFPSSTLLFDFVPFVGAAALLLMVFYGIAGSQTLAGIGRTPPSQPQGALTDIHAAILESKAFLDPDLSLQKLAQTAQLRPRALSEYLNNSHGMTFREYINSLRINEAKRLLTDPNEAQTSIEAAALLCGFRSRSSFYEAFKKRTGKTPAEFRKKPT